ncbi:PREDICTED: kit ligand [Nanorana parkeri]|uniref:kit ligand n=1 Tax=Nanorana parkeri TaxID=125878 RepID=UPI0008546B80|nr:PREDICTED: kit ligand [Nanorana parkeri]
MKKTKTWIVTCIYLQLLFICFGSPCRNPVTNAVNDIDKLVGNLPSDYIMHVKNISRNSLSKHCWLYVMVYEMSERLGELSSKLSNTSQNYLILDSLSLIFREIRNCVKLTDQQDFVDDYLDTVPEVTLSPRKFFNLITETISVFKEINNTHFDDTCTLPTVDPKTGDSVTKGSIQYASSKLKNGSRPGYTDNSEFISSSSLPWTSIASIAMACMVAGFLLGIMCWKLKHQRRANNEVSEIHADQKDTNELNNMLHQTEKEVSVI